MLSVFAVNSLADVVADDGFITLREALEAANTNTAVYDAPAGSATETDKIIIFAQDPVDPGNSRITLGGQQLEILDDVEIYGPGAERLAIDGNQQSRVFSVAADVEASLWGVTITGGRTTGEGGGVLNNGTLAIANATISANAGSSGGGVASRHGSLTVTNCVVSDNSASSGGGILVALAKTSIADSIISRNAATVCAGGVFNVDDRTLCGVLDISTSVISGNLAPEGAGIWNDTTLNIYNSAISGNTATGNGGGVYTHGDLVVTNSTFADNAATNGGGICVSRLSGYANIINCTLSGNTAISTSKGMGGAIYSVDKSTAIVTDSTIANNTAYGGGGLCAYTGSTLRVTGSTVSGNSAYGGGGFHSNASTLSISGSTVSGNVATTAGAGGIGSLYSSVFVSDSTITGNTSARGGGGIYLTPPSLSQVTMAIINSTISGNISESGGGGICVSSGVPYIINSTITDNVSNGDASSGAGLYGESSAKPLLYNTVIAGNIWTYVPAGSEDATSAPNDVSSTISPISSHNLIGVGSGVLGITDGVNGNQIGGETPLDPMLGPLADNGGSRLTHAPLSGSLLIDAGNDDVARDRCGLPLSADGRGFQRLFGAVDIGAVEAQPAGVPVAYDDFAGGDQGGSITLDVLANDFRSDASTLAAEVVEAPAHGTLVQNQDGTFTYTPEASFWGTDTFTYRARNGEYASNTAEVSLSVLSPTSIVVTTADDEMDGDLSPDDISLREALAMVSVADPARIQFSPALVGKTIRLTHSSEEPLRLVDHEVIGLGMSHLTIDGLGRVSAIEVVGNSSLSHLTVTGGYGHNITVPQTAVAALDHIAVVANRPQNSYGEVGGIQNDGTLAVTNSTISGNRAVKGGGIYNTGTLTVTDSILWGNGGWISGVIDGTGGGGIYNASGNIVISRSVLSGNIGGRTGGGVYGRGGELTITDSTISGNTARLGGGVFMSTLSDNATFNLDITRSTISDNYATDSGGGGGILVDYVTLTITDCTISGNAAYTGGGLLCFTRADHPTTIVRCVFDNNRAFGASSYGHGGAILATRPGSVMTIVDSTITNNSAAGQGGAIYGAAQLTVTGSTLSGNSATHGGGVYSSGGRLALANSAISHNTAVVNGGGMYARGTDVVTITGSTFSGNSAMLGGAIYRYAGTLTVTNSTLVGNSAKDDGGAIGATAAALSLVHSTLTANTAGDCGGAVYNTGTNSKTTVAGSTLSGNSAANGGGIYKNGDALSVVNSVFVGNSAEGSGGGILSEVSTLTLTNSTVVANVSGTNGGGVYSSGGTLAVANSILAMNRAPASADLYGILGAGSGGVLLGMDPGFVRNPSDGGDGWGDDPATADVDEGANDDFGNLRLRENSPAVNAGINSLAVDAAGVALATDRDGRQRIIYGTVDIGAYEFCVMGDADYSGTVDGGDAAVLAAHWGEGEMHWGDGDFNGDGRVNAVDAAILGANWGATFSPPAEQLPSAPVVPRSPATIVGPMPAVRTKYEGQRTENEIERAKAEPGPTLPPCASASSVVRKRLGDQATDAVLAEEYGVAVEPAGLARGRVAWSHVLARRKVR